MTKYRQVDRLAKQLDTDAQNQLESAVILHVDTAWRTFKWYFKKLIVFKCPVCGSRHFSKPFETRRDGYSMYCGYGWWPRLKGFRKHISLCLQHGED